MKQVLDTKGVISVAEVPAPSLEPGHILVHTRFSCISTGTELSGLRSSGTPLWRKALDKPQHVKKVMEIAKASGISSAIEAIQAKTSTPKALGYSLAGTVIGVGADVLEFKVGDTVACAGAQCAFHAEITSIPVNLAVKIPPDVSLEEASAVALGCISLQGVRRLEPTLGETFLVIGLGILGQMAAQILKANGCRVIGSDLNVSRAKIAEKLGLQHSLEPAADVARACEILTGGVGVDGVLICASGSSPEILHTAFQACRKKGRVVLVGDVPLQIQRNDMFEKELDFRISTSYGPGRYDKIFEERGLDYPLPYVRWTETRNMAAYLDLLASKKISIRPLIQETFPVEQAAKAFASLGASGGMTSLLEYPEKVSNPASKISIETKAKPSDHPILAILGAGSFTEAVHLPNIRMLGNRVQLKHLVCRTGHKAQNLANRFGASKASTDWKEPLLDPSVNCVLIGTRHNLHGLMAIESLRAGKHALIEKPLAITKDEVSELKKFYAQESKAPKPLLMTGFNRRFSPAAVRAKNFISKRSGPVFLLYRMNAGFIPKDHWVHGPEGGGRNIGEACHIYDLFVHLVGSIEIRNINVSSIADPRGSARPDDNFVATISFADGSVATLSYTSLGNASLPKEQLEAFFDGNVFTIQNYTESTWLPHSGKPHMEKHNSKGHAEELLGFFEGMQTGSFPISLEEQFAVSEIALAVQEKLVGESL